MHDFEMTAQHYRQRAVDCLSDAENVPDMREEFVTEAAVWSRIAISAAISEQTEAAEAAQEGNER